MESKPSGTVHFLRHKLFRTILWTQGVYYLITAFWPLLDIDSFMIVTGYKEDQWLVKTVGALLIPISVCMLMNAFLKTDPRPVTALCMLSCLAFMSIDLYYALNDVISDIYLLDAAAQALFLIMWIFLFAAPAKR